MIADIIQALRAVENAGDWTDPRHIVLRALTLAGIAPEEVIQTPNKTVCLVGEYAVKSCAPHQVKQAEELAKRLGAHAANLHASGRCWVVQERVMPEGPQHRLQRALKHIGAADITRNCGSTKDGRIVAFDGFIVPVEH